MADDTKQHVKDFANQQVKTNKKLDEILWALGDAESSRENGGKEQTEVIQDMFKQATMVSAEALLTTKGSIEGVASSVEDAIVGYMNNDKTIAQAIRKTGNEDLKGFLVDMQIDLLRQREEFHGQYQKQIDELQKSAKEFDWEGMATRAESMLYPVIEGAKTWVDNVRHELAEIPVVHRLMSNEMIEHYKTGLKEIQGVFQKHLGPILEPISMLTGPFTGLVKSMFIVGKTLLTGPTIDEKAAAKANVETAEILKEWLAIHKGDRLKKDVKKDKSDTPWALVGAILGAIGLGLGAYIGSYLKPLGKMLDFMTRRFKSFAHTVANITNFFGKMRLKVVTKLKGMFDFFSKLKMPDFSKMGRIGKMLGSVTKFFTGQLPKMLGAFGNFFKAFKVGFRLLGIPLRIVFTVIDFIKGFIATEGNIAQKIIGGLKQVVLGFVELPMRIMAWVWDATVGNLLGLFGIEVSADKLVTRVLDLVGDIFDGIGEMFSGGVQGIVNGLASIWNSLVGAAEDLVNSIPFVSGVSFNSAKFNSTQETPTIKMKNPQAPRQTVVTSGGVEVLEITKPVSSAPSASPAALAKAEAQDRQIKVNEAAVAAINQTTSTVNNAATKNEEAINQINLTNVGESSSRRREDIPSNIESAPLLFATQSWGVG